ncbi:hypothetical protein [Carnobacterium sp.]|uniref:hypothetical protein n=1 Tax=Carnobacterium sp. TaxID=48221 RepID=UPI003315C190
MLHQKFFCLNQKDGQGFIIISQSQSKKVGKVSSKILLLKPKRLASFHLFFPFSIQKNGQGFIIIFVRNPKEGGKVSCSQSEKSIKASSFLFVLNPKSRSRLRHFYLFSIQKGGRGFFYSIQRVG